MKIIKSLLIIALLSFIACNRDDKLEEFKDTVQASKNVDEGFLFKLRHGAKEVYSKTKRLFARIANTVKNAGSKVAEKVKNLFNKNDYFDTYLSPSEYALYRYNHRAFFIEMLNLMEKKNPKLAEENNIREKTSALIDAITATTAFLAERSKNRIISAELDAEEDRLVMNADSALSAFNKVIHLYGPDLLNK